MLELAASKAAYFTAFDHAGFGRVFVEFGTVEAAEMCARAMDGRYFDGQRVAADYYDVDDFLAERLGQKV